MKYYERLSKIREERGYSIKDIAQVLNATTTQVKKWENGEVKMRLTKYVLLSKFYKLSIDYIVGLIDVPIELE